LVHPCGSWWPRWSWIRKTFLVITHQKQKPRKRFLFLVVEILFSFFLIQYMCMTEKQHKKIHIVANWKMNPLRAEDAKRIGTEI